MCPGPSLLQHTLHDPPDISKNSTASKITRQSLSGKTAPISTCLIFWRELRPHIEQGDL